LGLCVEHSCISVVTVMRPTHTHSLSLSPSRKRETDTWTKREKEQIDRQQTHLPFAAHFEHNCMSVVIVTTFGANPSSSISCNTLYPVIVVMGTPPPLSPCLLAAPEYSRFLLFKAFYIFTYTYTTTLHIYTQCCSLEYMSIYRYRHKQKSINLSPGDWRI
jgi:hypothetical protein